MPTPPLGEFDRVAVRITNSHRPFPRLFVRRLKKFHPSTLRLFTKRVVVSFLIGGSRLRNNPVPEAGKEVDEA